jgi:hypothetical protein
MKLIPQGNITQCVAGKSNETGKGILLNYAQMS